MKIINFFSVKGGVGRTALMCNLGAYWASRGKVVLLVDMDLAAPGLSYIFHDKIPDQQGRGLGMSHLLFSFFEQFKNDPQRIQLLPPRDFIRQAVFDKYPLKCVEGNLFFIPSGQRHCFFPPIIPGDHPGENKEPGPTASHILAYYLKKHLQNWTVPVGPSEGRKIDYLLVDTYPGFPEPAGLHLESPGDKMVLVSSINDQNLTGLKLALETLKDIQIPQETFPLPVTVVLSPLPAPEDEQVFYRLEKARYIIHKGSGFNRSNQKEIIPRSFCIHYNPVMAAREAFPVVEHPHSLYCKEVTAIARHLDGEPGEDDLQDDTVHKPHRKNTTDSKLPRGDDEDPAKQLAPSDPWRNFIMAKKRLQETPPDKEGAKNLLIPLLESPPDDAVQCFKLGDLVLDALPAIAARAEACFRKSIQLDETYAPPWNGLGELLKNHLNRYEEAEIAYFKAIQLDETYAPPWNGLGNLLKNHLKRHEEAELAYRKAIQLDDHYAYPWNNLGNLLKNHLKRCEEAEFAYRKAIQADETYASPWNGLGNLLQEHFKCYDEAETAYRKAIQLDETYASPWNGLGNLLQDHLKNYEQAESAYRKAIQLDEQYASPWYGLGKLLHVHLQRYDGAESAYLKAIQLDEQYASPWYGLGDLFQFHLNRFDEAEPAYRKALHLDENDAYPWNGLGLLYRDYYRDPARAVEFFRQGLNLPNNVITPRLEMELGYTAIRMGDEIAGRKYLEDALTGFDLLDIYNANTFRIALELNDTQLIEKYLPQVKKETLTGDFYSELFLLFYKLLYKEADFDHYKEKVLALMTSYNDHFFMLTSLYYLNTLRPGIKKQAARLAAQLLTFPGELTGRFKDLRKPEIMYEPYRLL